MQTLLCFFSRPFAYITLSSICMIIEWLMKSVCFYQVSKRYRGGDGGRGGGGLGVTRGWVGGFVNAGFEYAMYV